MKTMNSEIQIIEKPSWVSWDEIHEVLVKAHASNVANGIKMFKPTLLGPEIEKEIGDTGKMFVALEGNTIVGTLALVKKEGRRWYINGEYGYLCFGAVLPEWSGKGIYKSLYQYAEATAKQMNLSVLTRDTNEKNVRMLKISKKEGYSFVECKVCKDHFNIIRAKWLDKCPFPLWYIKVRYYISKLFRKTRYKLDSDKGIVKRFGL